MAKIARKLARTGTRVKPREKETTETVVVKVSRAYKPAKLPYRITPMVERKIEEAIDQLPV